MARVRTSPGTLLRLVHLEGPLSRTALAARMGVNRSTILALTTELTEAGLVAEEHPTGSTGAGRPSLVVRPRADRVFVLAFDVAVDRLVAARVGLGGRILDRREAPRSRSGVDLETVVDVLAGFGRELAAAAPPEATFAGAGASYCGLIRPDDGTVRYGPQLGWVDQAFGPELGRALGLGGPVAVGNEAHLGALAEFERGAGIGCPNLIYLHGDVGVGGGILVGGELLGGDNGYGCEVGHMLVNPYAGRPCLCGSRGCLEAETAERALLEAAGRAGRAGREAVREVLADAARDPAAGKALSEIGDWLGIGVASLINLFNPGVVIFGGTLREVYAAAARPIADRIARHVLPVSRERTRLRVAALADDTTLLGAAELAFADLLHDPFGRAARTGPATGAPGRAGTAVRSPAVKAGPATGPR